MNEPVGAWGVLRKLFWEDVLLVLGVFVLARLLAFLVRRSILGLAEKVSPHWRLSILRLLPAIRLLIGLAALTVIIPILVEPTFRNVATLVAGVGFALAFTLKDYGLSFAAGLAAVMENAYQPGDWIEVEGAYGEVKSIGARATRIVTIDDTEVVIPHARLWSSLIFNATSGNRSLLCVADFYLDPDHDAGMVRPRLAEVAESSSYRAPETKVTVIVLEKPWGTHYRVKAYVKESREQFLFLTDVTLRGKAALRDMKIRFAQVPYATSHPDS